MHFNTTTTNMDINNINMDSVCFHTPINDTDRKKKDKKTTYNICVCMVYTREKVYTTNKQKPIAPTKVVLF